MLKTELQKGLKVSFVGGDGFGGREGCLPWTPRCGLWSIFFFFLWGAQHQPGGYQNLSSFGSVTIWYQTSALFHTWQNCPEQGEQGIAPSRKRILPLSRSTEKCEHWLLQGTTLFLQIDFFFFFVLFVQLLEVCCIIFFKANRLDPEMCCFLFFFLWIVLQPSNGRTEDSRCSVGASHACHLLFHATFSYVKGRGSKYIITWRLCRRGQWAGSTAEQCSCQVWALLTAETASEPSIFWEYRIKPAVISHSSVFWGVGFCL